MLALLSQPSVDICAILRSLVLPTASIVGSVTQRNWNCDNTKRLYSPRPCQPQKNVHGDLMGGDVCVGDIRECAGLAIRDDDCSATINYYGNELGPGGDYPGSCACVKRGMACGGWQQPGGNVARAGMYRTLAWFDAYAPSTYSGAAAFCATKVRVVSRSIPPPMAVNSVSSGSPHARCTPTGRTCGA